MQGLSLIEILLAMSMGAALLAGIAQVVMGMRMSERTESALSEIQEAGRFAIMFLSDDLLQTGYTGCSSSIDPAYLQNTLSGTPVYFNPQKRIQGWDATAAPTNDMSLATPEATNVMPRQWNSGDAVFAELPTFDALPGSDIVRIWGASDVLAPETTSMQGRISSLDNSARTMAVSDVVFSDYEIFMVSDCFNAAWVQACDVTPAGANNSVVTFESLNPACLTTPGVQIGISLEEDANAYRLTGNTYYVSPRDDVAGSPPVLYMRPTEAGGVMGNPLPLVEGVSNIQFMYGENTDQSKGREADIFVPADQVSDWTDVVSIRISLLVQSREDNLIGSPQAYTFNGSAYIPNDKRIRKEFTTTVNLRNRSI